MVESLDRCSVPTCDAGPCRTAATLILAEAAEVPVGCPNLVKLTDPATQLPPLLANPELYITPRAAGMISPSPTGARRTVLFGPLAAGRLMLLEARVAHAIRGGGIVIPTEVEPPTPVLTEEKTAWIKFKVVDDETGAPIRGVTLRVRLPNGQTPEYTTRPDGMIEIDGIDPGSCDIMKMTDDQALEVVRVE